MLVSYMETHTLFARGQITTLGKQGKQKYKLMWEQLAKELNNRGRATKTPALWKTFWKNLRLAAKQNKASHLFSVRKTGNCEIIKLSDIHERICSIFGHYGTGLSIIREVGVKNQKTIKSDEPITSLGPTMKAINNDLQVLHSGRIQILQAFEQQLIILLMRMIRTILLNKIIIQRNRSSKAQINFLISFMERNPVFARDTMRTEEIVRLQWAELAENLNCIGTVRTIEAWQRTWDDQVRIAKEANDDIDIGIKTTPLSQHEKKVLHAVGVSESVQPKKKYDLSESVPSTSKSHSFVATKRSSIDLTEENSLQSNLFKRNKEETAIDIAKESNKIISNLSTNLVKCFKQQNQIMDKSFSNIATNIEKMCAEIVTAFIQVKSQSSNTEDEDSGKLPPSSTPANDDYPDEEEFEADYLDEEYIND